jgi:cytochrome c biogenesis protein CcdA
MKTFMQLMGVILILFGVLFLLDALHVFRFDHPFVAWHMRWGRDAAWAIRIGMIILGMTLVFLTPKGDD